MTIQFVPYERFSPPERNKPSARPISPAVMTGFAVCLLATAGEVFAEEDIQRLIRKPLHPSEPSPQRQNRDEGLLFAKEILAVSMSDFALLLGVTRPTAYAWIEGKQNPLPEKFRAIDRVRRLASQLADDPIPRFDLWLKRPVIGGKSFLEVFLTNEDFGEALNQIRQRAGAEQDTRLIRKSTDTSRRNADSISHISPPLTKG